VARPLQARLTKWFLPGASVLTGALSGVRQDGGPRARDASDDLFFGVNLAGGSVATQGGREVTLRGGDAILLSDTDGSFTLSRPTGVRFVGVRVPRRAVAPLIVGADSAAMRLIPRGTEAVTLMTRYLHAVLDAEVLASAEVCLAVVAHVHDLIALSVGATRDGAAMATARGVRAARLLAIKADIAATLVDETLTVATVAARHGVTPRYVHTCLSGRADWCCSRPRGDKPEARRNSGPEQGPGTTAGERRDGERVEPGRVLPTRKHSR
jgi:hypothetical protein